MPNLLTFGSNDSHQLLLGAETTDDVLLPSPAPTPSISIASIAFGSSHTVLLSNSGVVYTLGANDNGQCGVSTVVANDVLSSPVRLESLATTYTITQAINQQPRGIYPEGDITGADPEGRNRILKSLQLHS